MIAAPGKHSIQHRQFRIDVSASALLASAFLTTPNLTTPKAGSMPVCWVFRNLHVIKSLMRVTERERSGLQTLLHKCCTKCLISTQTEQMQARNCTEIASS
jgi:hypothetical protein